MTPTPSMVEQQTPSVKQGRWDATLAYFPVTMGALNEVPFTLAA